MDSKHDYNKNFLKTKIRSYGDEVTDFYDKQISKVDSICTCLAVISLDSALRKDEIYYPQVLSASNNDNLSDFSSWVCSDDSARE